MSENVCLEVRSKYLWNPSRAMAFIQSVYGLQK